MKKITTLMAGAAAALALAAPASAQEAPSLPKSPAKACAALASNPMFAELYAFIATKPGACTSTLAKVGLEGLLAGAFPSNAAVVGNCKSLEKSDFLTGPDDTRPYPYTFYEGLVYGLLPMLVEQGAVSAEDYADLVEYYEANRALFTAKNRAGCVAVLKRIHPDGGIAGPIFALLPPMGPG